MCFTRTRTQTCQRNNSTQKQTPSSWKAARLNLNKQLWVEADLHQLFTELRRRSRNFLLLAVDCSCKNLGHAAGDPELLCEVGDDGDDSAQMLMYRLPCAGDNTGSYFREPWDAERVKKLLVEHFTFDLSPDPLDVKQELGGYVELPKEQAPKAPVRRWGRKT